MMRVKRQSRTAPEMWATLISNRHMRGKKGEKSGSTMPPCPWCLFCFFPQEPSVPITVSSVAMIRAPRGREPESTGGAICFCSSFHFAALSSQADETSDSPSKKNKTDSLLCLVSLSQSGKFLAFSSHAGGSDYRPVNQWCSSCHNISFK